MKIRNTWKTILVVILFLIIGSVLYYKLMFVLPPNIVDGDKFKNTERLLDEIENYYQENASLPKLELLQKRELFSYDEHYMFYRPEVDYFVLGFSAGFDEIYEYDSRNKKWSFE